MYWIKDKCQQIAVSELCSSANGARSVEPGLWWRSAVHASE